MADSLRSTPFLRFALLGDAAASGATGLLLAAGAGVLSSLLGLPEGLLRIAGLVLLPYAAFVAWIGTRSAGAPRIAVRAVVAVNLLWTLDSALGGPTAHAPLLDGLHALTFAAAVTNEIRLGVAVVVMSRRNPALLAHGFATVPPNSESGVGQTIRRLLG